MLITEPFYTNWEIATYFEFLVYCATWVSCII